eukprot:TRINITY_DN46428_c0_g1_i1.p1 TRINITY_DN46428_c0_g1~~TRINITY_DN46428_c0_g1_i1.p1  ORF type:complete len:137 (-),score=17.10 TRINITY_DN46428_c0_g1_i1:289-699(-)
MEAWQRLSDSAKHEAIGRTLQRIDPDMWQKVQDSFVATIAGDTIEVRFLAGDSLSLSRHAHTKVRDLKKTLLKSKQNDLPKFEPWSGKRHAVSLSNGSEVFQDDLGIEMLPMEIDAHIVEEEESEEDEMGCADLFD